MEFSCTQSLFGKLVYVPADGENTIFTVSVEILSFSAQAEKKYLSSDTGGKVERGKETAGDRSPITVFHPLHRKGESAVDKKLESNHIYQ